MAWQLRQLSDMSDIGDPLAQLPAALQHLSEPELADLTWLDDPTWHGEGFFRVADPAPAVSRWLNKVHIIERIPFEKQAAILAAARPGSDTYDAAVEVVLFQLEQAQDIELDGDLLTNGLAVLVSKGLLTADDVAAVTA